MPSRAVIASKVIESFTSQSPPLPLLRDGWALTHAKMDYLSLPHFVQTQQSQANVYCLAVLLGQKGEGIPASTTDTVGRYVKVLLRIIHTGVLPIEMQWRDQRRMPALRVCELWRETGYFHAKQCFFFFFPFLCFSFFKIAPCCLAPHPPPLTHIVRCSIDPPRYSIELVSPASHSHHASTCRWPELLASGPPLRARRRMRGGDRQTCFFFLFGPFLHAIGQKETAGECYSLATVMFFLPSNKLTEQPTEHSHIQCYALSGPLGWIPSREGKRKKI